jgi:hypothetical protein
MRFICIQNHGRTWYLDTTGKWSEHPDKLLTFDNALDAVSYISVRGLTDARVCICQDRGRKENATEQNNDR